MEWEERRLTFPPITPDLDPASIARIMESEVEVFRSFTRHIRIYREVTQEHFSDAELSCFQNFDSAMVNTIASMQEIVNHMKKLAEEGEAQ